ncbi:MAG TPA: BTAD domain-containing putative transcriptional regulator [Actinokineospora sp.]|nr:BTAD domain-containing putative transcriptional regulator [Actinokineospora sp.]
MEARFGILGAIEVSRGACRVDGLAPRHRAALAYLLVNAGRVVSMDGLIEALWGGAAPSTARTQVHAMVSTLRRELAAVGAAPHLLTHSAGYTMRLDAEQLDLDMFNRAVTAARDHADPGTAAGLLRTALGLWRGPALADVTAAFADGVRARLDQERLAAVEQVVDLDLTLGRHREVVAELTEAFAAAPHRERLCTQLMLAMYRCGQQSEALRVAREFRARLADEQGLDPGRSVTDLELAVLRSDPQLDPPTAPAPPAPIAVATCGGHNPLPRRVPDFTGRHETLTQVAAALTAPRTTTAVHVVSGMSGVGKSTLLNEVTAKAAAVFPDGTLYADLNGTPAGTVLKRFLGVLGVTDVPDGSTERAALFRTALADRKVLIVLDDPDDEAHVRPLIPASAHCAVLIASRGGLPGLDGATRTQLDVFDNDTAVGLLASIAGHRRVAAEPEAARQLAVLCGRLPLALRIAGAKLSTRPYWPVSTLVDRLSDERRRLDELRVGDLSVRGRLRQGCDRLDEGTLKAFRHMGGLRDFDVDDLARALAVCPRTADTVIERLVDAELVEYVGVDKRGTPRHRLPELVRLYAAELAEAADEQALAARRTQPLRRAHSR